MGHKAGFVNIIGNPNVGKSTLMNALVGENLSIITSKAQTTRHRIQGIVNGEDFQIVYSDTPGIIKPHYELQKSMMKYVSTALEDADLILYVTDVVEAIDKHEEYIKRLKGQEIPVFLILNKTDLTSSDKVAAMLLEWQERLPNALL
ncbi:MAG: GTPase Era, partial [Bacteroidota bacterium]